MAEAAELKRGAPADPGQASSLPKGAAQAANEALEAAAANPATPPVMAAPEGTEEAPPTEAEGILAASDAIADLPLELFGEPDDLEDLDNFRPGNEDEEILFEADDESTQSFYQNLRRPKRLPEPPQGMGEWLPVLAAIARDPQAPPGVVALFRSIIDTLYPFVR
jgi:hypothetical protein